MTNKTTEEMIQDCIDELEVREKEHNEKIMLIDEIQKLIKYKHMRNLNRESDSRVIFELLNSEMETELQRKYLKRKIKEGYKQIMS